MAISMSTNPVQSRLLCSIRRRRLRRCVMPKTFGRLTGSLLLLLLLIATPQPAAAACGYGDWEWHPLGAWNIETGVEVGWGGANYWTGTGCTDLWWSVMG